MRKVQQNYDGEISIKINTHIRNCSDDQRKKEVSAFDTLCSKFLKNIKSGR